MILEHVAAALVIWCYIQLVVSAYAKVPPEKLAKDAVLNFLLCFLIPLVAWYHELTLDKTAEEE